MGTIAHRRGSRPLIVLWGWPQPKRSLWIAQVGDDICLPITGREDRDQAFGEQIIGGPKAKLDTLRRLVSWLEVRGVASDMWLWNRGKLKTDLTSIANKWLTARGMEPWVLAELWRYSSGDYSAYKPDASIAVERFLFIGPEYSSLRFMCLGDRSKDATMSVRWLGRRLYTCEGEVETYGPLV